MLKDHKNRIFYFSYANYVNRFQCRILKRLFRHICYLPDLVDRYKEKLCPMS